MPLLKTLPFIVPHKPKGPKVEPKIQQRLPERKRMTLVAGLTGAGCGVMFADSQETISGYAKKSVDKLSYWDTSPNRDFRFAIGGAGDNGPYIDNFNFDLVGALLELQSGDIADVCKKLEKATVAFHKKHIWPQGKPYHGLESLVLFQRVLPPDRKTVAGERRTFHPCLIHVAETAVVPLINDHSKAIGIGGYLADYIADKLMSGHTDESQLVAVAIYILQQVKLHVDGVGLNGTLVMFKSDGTLAEYEHESIKRFEPLMDEFNELLRIAFRNISNTTPEDGDKLVEIAKEMQSIKSRYSELLEKSNSFDKGELKRLLERQNRLGS